MKTFRLIGIAFIAVLMCVNFTSCSSDDDEEELIKNDDGVIINQKKLMEIKVVYDNGESTINEYAYDDNGKLLSATHTDLYSSGRKEICTHAFTWGANNIIENRNGKAFTYTLKDGLITHRDLNNTAFTYNSNKQLIQHNEEGEDDSYTWQGEKLVQMTSIDRHDDEEEDIYEFSYSGKTCKGYLPIMVWYVVGDNSSLLMEAHPELIGMRCNQLPEQMFYKDIDKSEYYYEYYKETYRYESIYEETNKFDYTFDKDGYLESCTETCTSVETIKRSFEDKNGDGIITDDERNITETGTDTGTGIVIYTFKWE